MPIKTHPYGPQRDRPPGVNSRFTRWYGAMSRTRRIVTVGVLVACVVFVFSLVSSSSLRQVAFGAFRPFVTAGAWVGHRTMAVVESFRPLSAVERDMLNELRQEVRALRLQTISADEARRENRQLRELLELERRSGWQAVVAPVILRDPVSWNRRMRIGRGADSGILPGAVALVGTRVVGRVIEVNRRSAVISTVLDAECRLSVRLPENGSVGILQRSQFSESVAQSFAAVEFLPKDATYHEGDAVMTSGLSGRVPGGFLVGFLASDEKGRVSEVIDASFARVIIRPAVDLDQCRFVVILVPEDGD